MKCTGEERQVDVVQSNAFNNETIHAFFFIESVESLMYVFFKSTTDPDVMAVCSYFITGGKHL